MTCGLLCSCVFARAEPACTPYEKAAEDAAAREAAKAFLEHTRGKIRDYKVARSDCTDKVIIVFEGVGEDANVGNQGMIWYIKKTGEMKIIDGM
ncbi:MAG TPA: hypothetical protein VHC92_08700 [Rhodanobacteraceae bacterium]|jgi:hypothetical protein|nr:hypothetical protein [Rhodanobacteraceae bacterium]